MFCLLSLVFVQPASAASFDCSKASTLIEKEICKSPSLSALDIELSEIYNQMYGSIDSETKAYLKGKQLEWLKDERNSCPPEPRPYYTLEDCISQSYKKRIEQLTEQSKRLQSEDGSEHPLSKIPKITSEIGRIVTDAIWDEVHVVPYTYYPFDNNLVLINVSNTGRMGQGVYVVDTVAKKAQRALFGLPNVIERTHEWWLIKTLTMSRHTGMVVSYDLLHINNDSKAFGGLKTTKIISSQEDGEAGLCGSRERAKQFGWESTNSINSYNLEQIETNRYILSFNITEQNCETMTEEKSQIKYSLHDNNLNKL